MRKRTEIKEQAQAEAKSYGDRKFSKNVRGISKNLVTKNVDQAVARKSPVIEGFGKISRRKTEDKNVKELVAANGEVIGTATKLKKGWSVTIGPATIEAYNISGAIREFASRG